MESRTLYSVHKKRYRTPLHTMYFLQQLSDENYCCPVFPWGRIPHTGQSRCQSPTKRRAPRQTWRSRPICRYSGVKTLLGRRFSVGRYGCRENNNRKRCRYRTVTRSWIGRRRRRRRTHYTLNMGREFYLRRVRSTGTFAYDVKPLEEGIRKQIRIGGGTYSGGLCKKMSLMIYAQQTSKHSNLFA